MARSAEGKTAGDARQWKATKTANGKTLPLSDRLANLFRGRRTSESQLDDLAFTTANGCVIDGHNFRERVWLKTFQQTGIRYRSPNTARHTFVESWHRV